MCCCLATRADCVLVISIYGVSVSVALLSVLGLHGHDFGPGFSPRTTEALHQAALAVYGVSLATNLVLCVGLLLPNTEKLLLVPWLLAHTLLVMALMAAALYYLVLYTSLLCLDDCTVLLGYSISIIAAIITLLYCIYIVQDHFDALLDQQRVREKAESIRRKTPQITSL